MKQTPFCLLESKTQKGVLPFALYGVFKSRKAIVDLSFDRSGCQTGNNPVLEYQD